MHASIVYRDYVGYGSATVFYIRGGMFSLRKRMATQAFDAHSLQRSADNTKNYGCEFTLYYASVYVRRRLESNVTPERRGKRTCIIVTYY